MPVIAPDFEFQEVADQYNYLKDSVIYAKANSDPQNIYNDDTNHEDTVNVKSRL